MVELVLQVEPLVQTAMVFFLQPALHLSLVAMDQLQMEMQQMGLTPVILRPLEEEEEEVQ
jgi:hypothetical protein